MDERTRPVKITPFRWVMHEIDQRADTRPAELLSVSSLRGVVPRSVLTDALPRADDLSVYKLCRPGDIVLNRMSAYQGALGIARQTGIVSPDYAVLRTTDAFSPAYLHYVMRSSWFVGQMTARLRGIGSPGATGVRTPRVNVEELGDIGILAPPAEEQQRIADFLDDRVARIDQIITARNQQTARLEGSVVRASFDAVRGTGQLARRESGLAWLGTIPNSWPLVTVATEFHVDLGKMLDEKRQTGTSAIPYLRNTNVQWDHVDVSDLKDMDIDRAERERYCVRPGDLLICEGGQPGRSAVWLGELAPLGFQKALHRARSRGRSRPEWLLECLRVAAHLNVFAVENGQTTIGHLTNEQLRSFRLPFPDPSEQDRALERLHSCQAEVRGTQAALTTGVELLQEYKQSLITAAVTGELDVTTAGSGIPNPH